MDQETIKAIIAISKHETGNYTSKVFKQNNNLFGMREPRKRSTLATGSNLFHATFNSIEDSLNDWFLWWQMHGITIQQLDNMTYIQMVTFMKGKNYFTDSYTNYINGVKRYFYG